MDIDDISTESIVIFIVYYGWWWCFNKIYYHFHHWAWYKDHTSNGNFRCHGWPFQIFNLLRICCMISFGGFLAECLPCFILYLPLRGAPKIFPLTNLGFFSNRLAPPPPLEVGTPTTKIFLCLFCILGYSKHFIFSCQKVNFLGLSWDWGILGSNNQSYKNVPSMPTSRC